MPDNTRASGINCVRRNIYNCRRKTMPKILKELSEALQVLKMINILQIEINYSWPNAEFLGRRHLTQAWYQKIQKRDLAKKYNNELSEIGSWLKHLFGLEYLDPNDVANCFVMGFASYQPEGQINTEFADYLVDQYSDGIFSPACRPKKEHHRNIQRMPVNHSVRNSVNNSTKRTHLLFSLPKVLEMFQTQSYIKLAVPAIELENPSIRVLCAKT